MDPSRNRAIYPPQPRNPYPTGPTTNPPNNYGNPPYQLGNNSYNSGGNQYISGNNPYNSGRNANNSGNNPYNSGRNANNSGNNPYNSESNQNNSGGNQYNPRNNPYNSGHTVNNSGGNPYNSGNNPYNPGRNASNSEGNPYNSGNNAYNPGRNASNSEGNPYNSGNNAYNSGNNPYNPAPNTNNSDGNSYNSGNNPYNPGNQPNNQERNPYNSRNNPYNPENQPNNQERNPYNPGSNPYNSGQDTTQSQPNEDVEAEFRNTLLKGQPKVLGTVQIFIVFLHIILGTVIIVTENAYVDYTHITLAGAYFVNFWSIPFFLTSGILSIIVEVKPNPTLPLLNAFMAMNIVSSMESLGTLVVYCIDVYISENHHTSILTALAMFAVITNLLQFCVTVPLAHFARLAIAVKFGEQASVNIFELAKQYENPMTKLSDLAQHAGGIASFLEPENFEEP